MMNSMFSLIINEFFKSDKKAGIDYIKGSLKEGAITLEQPILFENDYITIKDFLRKQKSPKDSEGIEDLIKKYDLNNKKKSEMEAYYALSNMLYDIYKEYISLDEVKKKVEFFLLRRIDPELICNYINSYYESAPKRDFASKDFFLSLLTHQHSIYLFEEIIIKYLGFEKVKDVIEKDVLDQIYLYDNVNFFNIVRKHDVLKNIDLPLGVNLYKHIGVLKFEDLVKQNLLNESEKRELSEYYFKNKIEISEPLINNIDGTIIYQKENWFNVKTGQGDLISVLASTTQVINGERGFCSGSTNLIEIILNALKDKNNSQSLKDYILSREENLLVEYLANGSGYFKKKHYDSLVKKFPSLMERQSKCGLLDVLMNCDNFLLNLEPKTINLYKELPVNILIGNDSERLLKLAYSIPKMKEDLLNVLLFDDKINFYIDILDLMISATDSLKESDEKIAKSHKLFVLQEKIFSFLQKAGGLNLSTKKIQKKATEILDEKDNGLEDFEEYKNFSLIDALISIDSLNENYMDIKYLEKEKKMLLKEIQYTEKPSKNNKKRI